MLYLLFAEFQFSEIRFETIYTIVLFQTQVYYRTLIIFEPSISKYNLRTAFDLAYLNTEILRGGTFPHALLFYRDRVIWLHEFQNNAFLKNTQETHGESTAATVAITNIIIPAFQLHAAKKYRVR